MSWTVVHPDPHRGTQAAACLGLSHHSVPSNVNGLAFCLGGLAAQKRRCHVGATRSVDL